MPIRLFFESRKPIVDKNYKRTGSRTFTYRRPPRDGEVKGKANCRAAKRQKVLAMKAAGHFRGDNRPFVEVVKDR